MRARGARRERAAQRCVEQSSGRPLCSVVMATFVLVALSALALASGNVLTEVTFASANALSGVALASQKVLSMDKLMRRRLQENGTQPFQFYIDRLFEKTDKAPAMPSMNFPGGNNNVSRPESAYPDPLSRRTQLLFCPPPSRTRSFHHKYSGRPCPRADGARRSPVRPLPPSSHRLLVGSRRSFRVPAPRATPRPQLRRDVLDAL